MMSNGTCHWSRSLKLDYVLSLCAFTSHCQTLRLVRHHPNIAFLYGYHFADDLRGPKCLLFELAERGSLDRFLKSTEGRETLDWRVRINISLDIAKALNYLHQGGLGFVCFHRDVKPSNICLKHDFTAQLIDCGLSKIVAEDKSSLGVTVDSSRGVALGTPGYICKYYAGGGKEYESACDVFSLGIVLVELFTGCLQLTETNGQKTDLYDLYSLDEEEQDLEGDVDELAGEWDVDARQQFASMAVGCIARKPKPRPKIDHIVSTLRELAREHCKLSTSEQALERCEALLRSKKPSDLKDNPDVVVRSCPECMLGQLPCVTCHSTSEQHAVCLMCFQRHVERHVGDIHVKCSVKGCDSACFTDEEVLSYTDFNVYAHHVNIRHQRKQHEELLAKLGRLQIDVGEIDSKVDQVADKVVRSMSVLSSLAGGVKSPCPKLAILVPRSRSLQNWMKNPGKKSINLYFICGHSFTVVEPPIILHVTNSWIRKAAPFLKGCIFVLQVAVVSLKLGTGLSIPLPHAGLIGASKQLVMLDEVLNEALGADVLATLDEARSLLETSKGLDSMDVAGLKSRNPVVKELLGKAYQVIAQEANKLENFEWKNSMTPVLSKEGGIVWVKKEFSESF